MSLFDAYTGGKVPEDTWEKHEVEFFRADPAWPQASPPARQTRKAGKTAGAEKPRWQVWQRERAREEREHRLQVVDGLLAAVTRLGWLAAGRRRARSNHEDAIDGDVLDAWLDEDAIDATGSGFPATIP